MHDPGEHAGHAAEARAVLLSAMLDSTEEFRRLTHARLDVLPGYRAMPPATLAAVVDEITWSYRVFLDCVAQGRALAPLEVARLQATGESRAGQGVPLDELHRAFQTVLDDALTMLADLAREHAGEQPGSLEAVPGLSRELTGIALQVQNAMRDGHDASDASSPSADMLSSQEWIRHMLSRRPRAARPTATPPDRTDLVVVLPFSQDCEVARVLDELPAAFRTALPGPTTPDPTPHAVALVDHGLDDQQAAACYADIAGRHAALVVHHTFDDPDQIDRHYGSIRPLLVAATRIVDEPGAIRLDEVVWVLQLAATSSELAQTYVRRVLGPVLASRRHKRLLPTIREFVATNGTSEAAAQILSVDAKTVRNHLDQIAELTGHDLRTTGLYDAQRALDLLRFHRDAWPPPGDPAWNGHPDPVNSGQRPGT